MTAARTSLLLLAGLAGCAGPNMAQDWPLEPHALLRTTGGYQLELDEAGNVVARPDQDDVEANLGARLSASDEGVLVGERLTRERLPSSPLERGDLIVWALPQRPMGVAPVASAHAVRTPADLRGYALRRGARVALGVVRQGQRLALPLDLPAGQAVGLQLWAPQDTRPHGFTLVRIANLPEHLHPPHADPARGDFLVASVQADSAFALRGLRPLDVIPGPVAVVHPGPPEQPGPPALFGGTRSVRGADGVVRELDFSPPDRPEDWNVPLLVDVKVEPHETKVSVGPFGVLGQYTRRTATIGPDVHEWTRWHVLNLFGSKRETHAERTLGREVQVGLVGIPPFFQW